MNDTLRYYPIKDRKQSPELHRQNDLKFINAYLNRLSTPLVLQNHVQVLTFESRDIDLNHRAEALDSFLMGNKSKPETFNWGRTILAEIVSQQLIQATLSHALTASAMYVDIVPTSLDPSYRDLTRPYRKGIDLCFIYNSYGNGDNLAIPMCGIDVTLGSPDLVQQKRSHPGFQSETAMPTIVFSFKDLTYNDSKGKRRGFDTYLGKRVRSQIGNTGAYSPFYGLEDEDVSSWKRAIKHNLLVGLAKCRQGLRANHDHPAVYSYPYLNDIFSKIILVEKIIDDFTGISPSALQTL